MASSKLLSEWAQANFQAELIHGKTLISDTGRSDTKLTLKHLKKCHIKDQAEKCGPFDLCVIVPFPVGNQGAGAIIQIAHKKLRSIHAKIGKLNFRPKEHPWKSSPLVASAVITQGL